MDYCSNTLVGREVQYEVNSYKMYTDTTKKRIHIIHNIIQPF